TIRAIRIFRCVLIDCITFSAAVSDCCSIPWIGRKRQRWTGAIVARKQTGTQGPKFLAELLRYVTAILGLLTIRVRRWHYRPQSRGFLYPHITRLYTIDRFRRGRSHHHPLRWSLSAFADGHRQG